MRRKRHKGKTSKALIGTVLFALIFVVAAYSTGIKSAEEDLSGTPTGGVIKIEADISEKNTEIAVETTTTTVSKAVKTGFKVTVLDSKLSINPGEAGYIKFLVEPDEVYAGKIKSYIEHKLTPDNLVWGINVLSAPAESTLPVEFTSTFNTTIGVAAGKYSATVKFEGETGGKEFPVEMVIETQRKDKSFNVCKSGDCDFTEIKDAFKAVPNAWVTVIDNGVYEGGIDIAGNYPRLDCGNSVIKGSGKYGIKLSNVKGYEVDYKGSDKNSVLYYCNIAGSFETGISIENSEKVLISYTRVSESAISFSIKNSNNIWLKDFFVKGQHKLFDIRDSSYIDCSGELFVPYYTNVGGANSVSIMCSDNVLQTGTSYDKNSYDNLERAMASLKEEIILTNSTSIGSNDNWGTGKTSLYRTLRDTCALYWDMHYPDGKIVKTCIRYKNPWEP